MEPITHQLEVLEDFHKQLQETGTINKSMVKTIEKSIGSNFITSIIRTESYTDTPTATNLEQTHELIKGKIDDLRYQKDASAYTLEDFHNDIVVIQSFLHDHIVMFMLKEKFNPTTKVFLEDPKHYNYYGVDGHLVNYQEVSFLRPFIESPEWVEALFNTKESDKPGLIEQDKANLLRAINEFIVDNEITDHILICPFFKKLVETCCPDELLTIKASDYDVITGRDIVQFLNNPTPFEDVEAMFGMIRSNLQDLAFKEPNETTLEKIREIANMFRKYNNATTLLHTFFRSFV